MESETLYRVLLMLAIIAANAFFAGAEVALVSLRRSRLRQLADEGATGAQAALSLLERPERLLSTGQIGLTLCSLALGWVGQETMEQAFVPLIGHAPTPALHAVLHAVALGAGFAVMTFFHVVLGEVVPKNWSMEHADRFALLVAPALLIFYRIAEPFIWAIERTSAALSRFIGVRRTAQHGAYSADEIKHVLDASEASGQISTFENQALTRLLELRELSVREIMVPRDALSMVSVDVTYETLLQVLSETHHSRLPVYEGARDHIIGILHVKDIVRYARARARSHARLDLLPSFDARRYLRPVPYVPETKPLAQHIVDLRDGHAIVSFVVDEYGTVTGMISAGDIVEQVFGRIRDEYDPLPLARDADAAFTVEGTLPLRDLETEYGIKLEVEAEYETLAGFLSFHLQRIPHEGDTFVHDEWRYTVEEMEGIRVAEVRIEPVDATEASNVEE